MRQNHSWKYLLTHYKTYLSFAYLISQYKCAYVKSREYRRIQLCHLKLVQENITQEIEVGGDEANFPLSSADLIFDDGERA